ncbi:MAG: transposase [Bacilli bacterium]|nr:transposase [Bacilli bacterium]
MKTTLEEKLRCVKLHLKEGLSFEEVSKTYGVDRTTLKYCCNLYQRYGDKAFKQSVGRMTYTRKDKLACIEAIISGKKSYREVALDMMLTNPKIVSDWVLIYKRKGEAAIKDTYSREAYKHHDDKVLEKEYKKLLEDLERTKAENEYLKKSFPQILARSKQSKKK